MLPKSELKAILIYVSNMTRSHKINSVLRSEICDWATENEALFMSSKKHRDVTVSEKKKHTLNDIKSDAEMLLAKVGTTLPGPLDKTLGSLVGLFGLKKSEAELLGLMVRIKKYGFLEDLHDRATGTRRRHNKFGTLDDAEFLAILTGMRVMDVMTALRPQNRLLSCGLLEIDHSEDIEVTKPIMNAFQPGVAFSDPEKLRNILAGDVQRSTLRWEDFSHLGQDRAIIETLLNNAVQHREKGINILLYGKPGTGKTEFCKTLATRLGISLYAAAEIDASGGEPDRSERLQSLRLLQAMLCHSGRNAIMLDEAEDVFGYATGGGLFSEMFSGSSTVHSKVYMNRLLENNTLPVFWLTNSAKGIDKAFVRRMSYCLEFSELPFDVRLRISKNACSKNGLNIPENDIRDFNKEYEVAPAVFSNAARITAIVGGNTRELRQVVDRQEKLLGGKKVLEQPTNAFSTALLNTDVDLIQISQSIVAKGKKNFSFCLYGAPGTGKSEYARWLANQMGMEVLLKRASDLLSKWVGGTEENIAQAFSEARTQNKLLIFDEADSLLHSRRNARTSWEVSHVNEMLTWMERHPLPFVCTTNLSEHLDEASFRRFTFKVRFEFLSSQQIAEAFRQFFGMEATTAVMALPNLAPGDFAVVKKKAEYFGSASAEQIGQMLKQETSVKTMQQGEKRMGFLAS